MGSAAENWGQLFRWALMNPGTRMVVEIGYLLDPDGELELTPTLRVASMECDVPIYEKKASIVSGAVIEGTIQKLLGGVLNEYRTQAFSGLHSDP
jgi:hypothetical protein